MKKFLLYCLCISSICVTNAACSQQPPVPVSISGVKEAIPVVPVGNDGHTSEQRNILDRLQIDNKPGAIKHLYVFSAMSGQCILYSTVREKVTSSGKRLSPTSVNGRNVYSDNTQDSRGIGVKIGDKWYTTTEVLQDDGTYGSSIEYLYWFDQKGVFHAHYISGGQIVHISNEPMPIKSIIVNLESK